MADEADQADEFIQRMLANPRNPYEGHARIKPIGVCHYCFEALPNKEQLFCDSDCAQDWSDQEAARVRNGG